MFVEYYKYITDFAGILLIYISLQYYIAICNVATLQQYYFNLLCYMGLFCLVLLKLTFNCKCIHEILEIIRV